MTSYASAAASLTNALHLSWPPIAVCLAASVPDGIPHYTGPKLPAGCVFWQEASKGVFTTSANDHNLCAIGIPTGSLTTQGQSYLQVVSFGRKRPREFSPLQPTTTISALSGCTRTILRPASQRTQIGRMSSRCSPSWATSAQTKYLAFQF